MASPSPFAGRPPASTDPAASNAQGSIPAALRDDATITSSVPEASAMQATMAPTAADVPKTPVDLLAQSAYRESPFPLQGPMGSFTLGFASVADEFPRWGTSPRQRDLMLRAFALGNREPILTSTIYATAAKYAAYDWSLNGAYETSRVFRDILHTLGYGNGWIPEIYKFVVDIMTQDNGGFMEIIRTRNDPDAPTVSLNHLDSNRCVRTGQVEYPIIYYNGVDSKPRKMAWYQIFDMTDMPSPVEQAYGMQYCYVTRILAYAQMMRDIMQYRREKISGRFVKQIHIVNGVASSTLQDVMDAHKARQSGEGLLNYVTPVVIGTIDPQASLAVETIDLAGLPDGFAYDEELRWYITTAAMAAGGDYQDFAPLPSRSGSAGGAGQGQTLHQKSSARGPALFMRSMEQRINFHGIAPKNVTFSYSEVDVAAQTEKAQLASIRGTDRSVRIAGGEITPLVAAKMAIDVGDLDPKYLPELEAHYEEQKQLQAEDRQQQANLLEQKVALSANAANNGDNPTSGPGARAQRTTTNAQRAGGAGGAQARQPSGAAGASAGTR